MLKKPVLLFLCIGILLIAFNQAIASLRDLTLIFCSIVAVAPLLLWAIIKAINNSTTTGSRWEIILVSGNIVLVFAPLVAIVLAGETHWQIAMVTTDAIAYIVSSLLFFIYYKMTKK